MKVLKPGCEYHGDLCTAVSAPVGNVYTATIGDGSQVVEVTDASIAVLVGDFVYYKVPTALASGYQADPTWLHCTAAEYAKWILG